MECDIKVKIWSAFETRGFAKGPSHDLMSHAFCKRTSTLTLSYFFRKQLYLEVLSVALEKAFL